MKDLVPNYVKTVLEDKTLKTMEKHNLIFDFYWNNKEFDFCSFLTEIMNFHKNRILSKMT